MVEHWLMMIVLEAINWHYTRKYCCCSDCDHARSQKTIHDVCDIVGLSYGMWQRILFDELNMRRIVAKFIRLLSAEQRQHRLELYKDLQNQLHDDPDFLSKVVTGDESWVYGFTTPKPNSSLFNGKVHLCPAPKKSVK
ncbi:hypothetical protein ANN_09511 [Periplaneta americana]|uniref:Uncharacterized protein n=1 Tax=Periplaneta americana TaxID=6978 RepID=A0ABQ8TLH7_PERAM|nr:hypothetical protein ANN_09511 [Periplaneta americana]